VLRHKPLALAVLCYNCNLVAEDTMHRTPCLFLCRLILPAFLFSSSLLAQHDRVVKGTVRPEAQPLYDQGPLAGDAQLSGIMLMLKPSADQQAALEQLLADQQDASSPDYHNWLTPRQYADRFGLSNSDIGRITEWLKDQGFSIGHGVCLF
jgi:hypothetical protein